MSEFNSPDGSPDGGVGCTVGDDALTANHNIMVEGHLPLVVGTLVHTMVC